MTRRPTSRALALLLPASLLLAACDDDGAKGTDTTDTPRFRSETGAVPPSPQRPGDPEAGYRALVNEPYVACGIPYDAYRRIAGPTDPDSRIPGRTGRNAELPFSATAHVNAEGVEIVASNCLVCHAARIGGELVIGLGNEFADFTGDPRRTALQAGNYVRGEAETRAWQTWADRLDGIAPHIQTRTVGVNPATNLTWALMTHLDAETLAWSREPLLDPPPTDPLPISVPPWWGMRHKNAMFYTTIGRGDHARFMLLASMLCIENAAEAQAIGDYAADIRAFITSLRPPAYPYPVDAALAAEGAALYARDCADCHGTPGEDGSYPNIVYPLAEIGTDPAYATAATDGSRDRFFDWVARSPYGDENATRPAPGYIAPPLDGIWATAPYLHNGSVPSLRALLSSPLRPRYWRHRTEPREYDPDALGWRHDALDAGQADEPDPAARRLIYDTTLHGYGNGGHTYSDGLSEAERAALLEYLKTF